MGISQNEIAIALGVTQSVVSAWERGVKKPSSDNLIQLAELLSCSTDYILEKEEDTGVRQWNEEEIGEWIEASTRGYTADEFKSFITSKPILRKITGFAASYLSAEDSTLISDYHRAPDHIKNEVRKLLASYSDRTAERLYKDAVNQKNKELENGDISLNEFRKWTIKAHAKYDAVLSSKISTESFALWLAKN